MIANGEGPFLKVPQRLSILSTHGKERGQNHRPVRNTVCLKLCIYPTLENGRGLAHRQLHKAQQWRQRTSAVLRGRESRSTRRRHLATQPALQKRLSLHVFVTFWQLHIPDTILLKMTVTAAVMPSLRLIKVWKQHKDDRCEMLHWSIRAVQVFGTSAKI